MPGSMRMPLKCVRDLVVIKNLGIGFQCLWFRSFVFVNIAISRQNRNDSGEKSL